MAYIFRSLIHYDHGMAWQHAGRHVASWKSYTLTYGKDLSHRAWLEHL